MAKSLRQSPASLLGLTAGSYEAYCFDQAIWHFGTTIEQEIEKANAPKGKQAKAQADAERIAKRTLQKYLNGNEESAPKGTFADPAVMFGTT